MQQAEDDVLHVFTHVTRFRERRRIGDSEGHIENFRQRAREQSFARTRRADHEDVALLDLNFRVRQCRSCRSSNFALSENGRRLDALVMIVNRHGERLLGVFLADAMQIKLALDLDGFEDVELGLLLLLREVKFAIKDVFAKDDAVVADINSRSGDELLYF